MYYFLVCDSHKELCPAASNEKHLFNSYESLPIFITEHNGCRLRVITDGGDDDIFNEYKNWSNCKFNALVQKSFLRKVYECLFKK